MTDLPVREAGVLNAQVTSDVHLACRAEIERLRAFLQEIEDVAPEFTGVPDIARRALKRS